MSVNYLQICTIIGAIDKLEDTPWIGMRHDPLQKFKWVDDNELVHSVHIAI